MKKPEFDPAHPAPCIFLKHGAYWYVKGGKWERLATTLDGALTAYAKRTAAQGTGSLPALLEKAYAHHLTRKSKAGKPLARNTVRQYRPLLNELKVAVQNFEPDQLKQKHVAQIKLKGVDTPNHTNRRLSLLRTLYDIIVEWQMADSNPCHGVHQYEERQRGRLIEDWEWTAIREKAGLRLQLIMDLQYLTGQRIGDVLRIQRRDLTEKGILFKPQKTRNSTGKQVCVAWNDDMRVTVARALELQGSVAAMSLFVSRSRRKATWGRMSTPDYRSVHEQFTRAATLAGIKDVRPNDQRAMSLTGTDAEREGTATALAVHSSPAMTERYLRMFRVKLVQGPSAKPAKKAV